MMSGSPLASGAPPKEFRLKGTEVAIEKRGNTVIIRPNLKPKLKTLAEVARYMREHDPQGRDFPDIERPNEQQKRPPRSRVA